jgi:hypothetical protein
MTSRRFLIVILLTALAATAAQGQTPPRGEETSATDRASPYDTPPQTEAKRAALAQWATRHSSKERPAAGRKEYAARALEILKGLPPHRITYDMYTRLATDDQHVNFLPNAWLTFGNLPDEISRTLRPGQEVVVYQWKNADGSNVLGTFRNGHLVSKAQAGLR